MKIHCKYDELKNLSDLLDHPKNRNTHSASQIERLAKLFTYHGVRHPIIVSKRSGHIVAGHGRKLAAQEAGLSEFPVVFQDFESDEQEYAFIQSDNAIASWAELDFAGINDDLPDLGPDFDLEMLGIKDFALDVSEKLEVTKIDEEKENDAPEVKKEHKCVRGDVWVLGNHRLVCGDSTMIDDVDKLMSGKKADMLFTDPPYGVNYEGGHFHCGDVKVKNKREKLINDNSTQIYKDIVPIITAFVDGPCYTWFASTKMRGIIESIESIESIGELHAMIIWNKINATYGALNAQYKQRFEPCFYWKPKGSTLRWSGPTNENTVWDIKRDPRNNYHPTQKPVALAERAIRNHEVETVLDLFGGSGSTLIACEKLGRKARLMELSESYCDVIIQRWQDLTGKKAVRQDGASFDEVDFQA